MGPVFSLFEPRNKNMSKNILTIVCISLAFFLVQGSGVSAAILPSEVISLVNQDRKDAGLPALVENTALNIAAEAKANDMATEQYFSHTSPKGVTPWNWFRKAKYEYRYAGENLAIHFHDANTEERAWMESKKHCENIMSPKYLDIGVAVREMEWEGKRTTVAVQMFGTQTIDEQKLHLADNGTISCPKVYPLVLGASIPTHTKQGMFGVLRTFLLDTATHWKIDTVRLLVLLLVIILQLAGLSIVAGLAMGNRWLRRW